MATTTSALATLKLAIFTKPAALTAPEFRRNKLAARLREQLALAEAEKDGTVYAATRQRVLRDSDGVRSTVIVPKRVKHWWHKDAAGKVILTVRYGSCTCNVASVSSFSRLPDQISNMCCIFHNCSHWINFFSFSLYSEVPVVHRREPVKSVGYGREAGGRQEGAASAP